jgi:hypothetical protein
MRLSRQHGRNIDEMGERDVRRGSGARYIILVRITTHSPITGFSGKRYHCSAIPIYTLPCRAEGWTGLVLKPQLSAQAWLSTSTLHP